MKRTIKLTETELKNLIKESVNNILKEAYETVQWQHFNNGPTDKEMFNDAIEAIEMSDGQIDFDEWYPAFQDYIDYDEAEEIWVRALKHCGYSGMLYNESKLKQIVAESVKKVLSERIKAEKGMTDDEVISRRMDNYHKDRFADRNIFDKHFSEPSIEDYTPEPEEGWYEYFNRQRRLKHLGKQNRKR